MIKLLIVDDEKTIRNGLQRHIDWNGLGVDMVQSAASAEEALMICDEFIPDIVLSDIRMRGMTGVEMCTKIHALYPECQIIFVSGYSDKEYLKAAISLGAVAYIEKPVVPEQLSDAVKKAVATCRELHMKATADVALERSRGILGQIVLRALAYNDYADDFENSLEFLEILPGKFPCYRMCVLRAEHHIPNLISVQKELRRILSYLPAVGSKGMLYGAFLDDRDFCLLLAGEDEDVADDSTVLAALCGLVGSLEVQGHRFFLAGGLCVSNWNMLHDSFESTGISMQELFFRGWGHFALKAVPRSGKAINFDKRLMSQFSAAFSARDTVSVDTVLQEIYYILSAQTDADQEQIRGVYYSLDYQMGSEYEHRIHPEAAPQNSSIPSPYSMVKMQRLDTLEELHVFSVNRAHHILDLWKQDDENCSAVQQVMRILQMNYADKNLSVKTLAESVFLTPTYLSGLFKKQTGKTIGQFLTELRIEYSMGLLMDKQLKLYHIAEMVGYDDPNYYAKIFKRHVGMTPSEFREKKLQ